LYENDELSARNLIKNETIKLSWGFVCCAGSRAELSWDMLVNLSAEVARVFFAQNLTAHRDELCCFHKILSLWLKLFALICVSAFLELSRKFLISAA
jgi:hypothetical protein